MARFLFIIRKIIYFFTQSKLPKKIGKGCEVSPSAIFTGKRRGMELAKGSKILDNARLYCNKNASIYLGENSFLAWNVIVTTTNNGGFVKIGKNCSVNAYSILQGSGGITIGDNVRIAQSVNIIAFNHNLVIPKPLSISKAKPARALPLGMMYGLVPVAIFLTV